MVPKKTTARPIRPSSSPLVTLWNWFFTLAIYGVLGFVALNMDEMTLLYRLAQTQSLFSHIWLLILAVMGLMLLTSAVHELGHLIGGWLVGFRFQLLIIGPLKISRQREGIRIGLNHGGPLFNGLAASLPPDNHQLRWRMLAFALGGPAASLLLAVGSTALFLHFKDNFDFIFAYAWVVESAAVVALISFVFCLTSLKPGQYNNGLPADGGRILTLLQGNASAERWCALIAINGADMQGQRPRQWEQTLINQVLSVPDGSYDALTARIIAYQWALDNGRITQAGRLLDEALDTWTAWTTGMRARLALEKAYYLARHQQAPTEAREWFNQVQRSRLSRALQKRAEAAILWAEGQHEAAQTQAQAGIDILQNEPPSGVVQAEIAWLQEIKEANQCTSP